MGSSRDMKITRKNYTIHNMGFTRTIKRIAKNYQLYIVLLIPIIYLIIFKYIPMYGAQIAFRNFQANKGLWNSDWVGLYNFIKFFKSYQFIEVLTNTVVISLYSLIVSFPFPIVLAMIINDVSNSKLKKTVQMVTYAPHFISTVVMASLILQFLSLRYGIVNNVRDALLLDRVNFIGIPEYFSSIYVWSGVWQNTGWGTIIYLAALSGVDPALHEAATIDGATKLQKTLHINLPTIMPTIVILLILDTGRIMDVGFEKVLLLQNALNMPSSEIIQTYVYKIGLTANIPNFSYSTAIGLFNSLINFVLIIIVNSISKKISQTSLW